MFVCVCREIRTDDIIAHLERNPSDLQKTWQVVSENISGRPPQCNSGAGQCHTEGVAIIEFCQTNTCG